MAANPIQARGLELIYSPRPIIVPAQVLAADSAVLGYNDAVKITGIGASGQLTVTRTSAGGGINGVIQNPKVDTWSYMDTDRRRTASTLTQVEVLLCAPGDGQIFRVQASTDADFAVANFATTFYCDLDTVGDADSVTGISTMEVNLNTVHASTGDLFILGLDGTYGAQNTIAGIRCKLQARIANT